MKRLFLILILALSGMIALGLAIDAAFGQELRATLDTQHPATRRNAWTLPLFEGTTPTVRAVLLNNGTPFTAITGWTGVLHIYTNETDSSTFQIASTAVDTTNGYMDFKFTSIGISPGEYKGVFQLTDGTDTLVWGSQGKVEILDNPGSGSPTALVQVTPIAWGQVSGSGNLNFGGGYIENIKGLWDDDEDTGIQLQESADEDIIRFDAGGSERLNIDNLGAFNVNGDFDLTIDADANGDTDFIIRNGAGDEQLLIGEDGAHSMVGNLAHEGWRGVSASGGRVLVVDDTTDRIDILAANLRVGNGTPNAATAAEDAYIEGLLEVDGGIDVAGTVTNDWTAMLRKADGSEDPYKATADTPAARQVALQAAWAAFDSNMELHIGPGEFDTLGGWYQVGTRVGTPRVCDLILNDKTNIVIQGHGTILKTTETGSHMVLAGITNAVVDGITFLSTRPPVITTGGETLFGAIEVVQQAKNITIRNCKFDRIGNHCIVDFKYANTPVQACTAERVIAHDCIFISCGDDDINADPNVANDPDAGMFAVTGNYCGMFNCTSFDCVRGFEMEGGTGGSGDIVGMFCIGNSMYDLTDDALMVFHPSSGNTYKRFVFKDNFCHSVSGLQNGDGLFMSGGEEWTISGNTFLNFGRGIVVTDGGVQTRYGLIEGNHVHNTGAGHGIYVEESGGNGVDWISIIGNRASRCSSSGFFIEGTSLQVIGNVASDNSKSGTGAGFYFENSVTTAHVMNNTAEDSASFNSQDHGFWFDSTLPANGIQFGGNMATPHVTSMVNIESAGDVEVLDFLDGDNGRVGIGNAAPTEMLDVTGNVEVSGTVKEGGVDISPIGKQDIYIDAAAMRASTTAGCSAHTQAEIASGEDIYTLDFDGGVTVESAQFDLALPKNWNEGTITYFVHWSSTAADTDGVTWGLEAASIADNEGLDRTYGTRIDVDDANQSAASEQLVSAESAALTINGAGEGEHQYFKVTRQTGDANDTATEDARLHGIRLRITLDAATTD